MLSIYSVIIQVLLKSLKTLFNLIYVGNVNSKTIQNKVENKIYISDYILIILVLFITILMVNLWYKLLKSRAEYNIVFKLFFLNVFFVITLNILSKKILFPCNDSKLSKFYQNIYRNLCNCFWICFAQTRAQ